MELTDKMLDDAIRCGCFEGCTICLMPYKEIGVCLETLAAALKAERAKFRVWENSPDWADTADITFTRHGDSRIKTWKYIRELPKSRERLIAEKWSQEWKKTGTGSLEDNIEAAILEAKGGVE